MNVKLQIPNEITLILKAVLGCFLFELSSYYSISSLTVKWSLNRISNT